MIHDFVDIGAGHVVVGHKVNFILDSKYPGMMRLRQKYRRLGRVIDLRCGRQTRSMILLDNEIMLLSHVPVRLLVRRCSNSSRLLNQMKRDPKQSIWGRSPRKKAIDYGSGG